MPPETGAALLAWFDEHKRDLPWRRTNDPYAIWVSEIMLQQTRVAAVLDHYGRWMQRFPTVVALAAVDETDVLALWSGLGYYRRARMLHRAAQAVVAEHGGSLPRTAAALRSLPGIGEYTSAAIASIAFGEATAVVDGNVERIVTRLAGLAPAPAATLAKAIRTGAADLLNPGRAGDSNQAMMELGATVCLPRAPLCLHCPVQPWCLTRGEHLAAPRKALVARTAAYALVRRDEDGAILLEQRSLETPLMAGMWELPAWMKAVPPSEVVLQVKHAITVTQYTVSIVQPVAAAVAMPPGTHRWVLAGDLPTLPLTGLARKVLRRLAIWPSGR